MKRMWSTERALSRLRPGEPRRSALAARRLGSCATQPPADRARLAAVRGVTEREPRQLDDYFHGAALGLQAGSRDPVADPLAVEPRQLALAEDVHEAGSGLAVQRLRLRRVELRGPVRLGR